MKNILWALSLFVIATAQLAAQTTANNNVTPIYFASGSAELDATAQAQLEQWLQTVRQYKDFEIEIRAFTDDRGSIAANQTLAARRSESIKAFLAQAQIVAGKQKVENIGEIALSGKNAEAERAKNRRVELIVTPFAPQNLQDLFGYFQANDQQQYRINCKTANEIKGEKGAVLYIPANSLQTQNGNTPVGEVTVKMREMHSFADMLRANLTTHSGGQMLETGGMVYIEATDAAGNQLEVRPEQQLLVMMPTKMDNMSLFVADRDASDPHQTIDWELDAPQTVVENISNTTTITPSNVLKAIDVVKKWKEHATTAAKFGLGYTSSGTVTHNYLVYSADSVSTYPSDVVINEEIIERPTPLPTPYNLLNNRYVKPTMEWIIENAPRKRGEKKSAYKERIDKVYAQRVQKYEENVIAQNEARIQYRKDSIAYYQQLAQYKEQQKRLTIERTKLLQCYQTMSSDYATIAAIRNDAVSMTSCGKESVYTAGLLLRDKAKSLLERAKALKMNDAIMALEQVVSSFLSDWEETPDPNNIRQYFSAQVDSIYNNLFMLKDKSYDGNWNWANKKHRDNLQRACNRAKELFSNQEVLDMLATFKKRYSQLHHICDYYLQNVEIVTRLENKIESAYADSGLATTKERLQAAGTVLGITRLGWINCDRFYKNTAPKTNVEVVAQNITGSESEQYFIVFKNLRSVMPLVFAGTRFVSPQVPNNEAVKLVGIRVKDGGTEVFIQEGMVNNLKGVNPIFRPVKISELQAVLEGV